MGGLAALGTLYGLTKEIEGFGSSGFSGAGSSSSPEPPTSSNTKKASGPNSLSLRIIDKEKRKGIKGVKIGVHWNTGLPIHWVDTLYTDYNGTASKIWQQGAGLAAIYVDGANIWSGRIEGNTNIGTWTFDGKTFRPD